MKQKKLASLLLCAAIAVSALSGCGSGSGSSSGATGASTTSSASGEIDAISVTDGSEDAMVLNTAKTATLEGLSASRHLYEGLYKLDEKGGLTLGQAKSVDKSSDGKTYTFTLRDDIKWSDGKPVTAGDFVYGWEYLKKTSGDYSSLLSVVSDAQAKDDKTLVVTLSYPCSYFPSILAFPPSYPVRKDIADKYGDAYATDPDKAVYNGAYKMTEWTHQQSVVMQKRDDYYDASKIKVKQITWDLMTDPSTMLASYQSGDVIFSTGYPQEQASALKDKGLHFAPGYNTYCVMFNMGKKGPAVLKNAKVRQALSLAIDRKRIISIRNLDDEIGTTYTPSGLTDSSGKEFNSTVTPWFNADTYSENCEKAKQLLSEAGYANGKGFPALKYLVNNDDRKEVAEEVVGDWKNVLGIDSVTVQSTDSFFATRQSQDYDIAYFGWYMDYPDISNMLYTCVSGVSDSGYADSAYDAAYKAAIAETDQKKQWEDYGKCETLLSQAVPVAPILHEQNSYLFDDTKYDGLVYYCGNEYFGYIHSK